MPSEKLRHVQKSAPGLEMPNRKKLRLPGNFINGFNLSPCKIMDLYKFTLVPTGRLVLFCGRVPWLYQYWPGGFMVFVVLCPGTPEGSTGSGSGFKASQKTGQRLKVSSDRLGEAWNRTCDPWFTRHRFIPYTTADGWLTVKTL